MKIEKITLRHIRLPLIHFFETSFGRTTERQMILVEASSDGVSGWGEVTAGESPLYNEEWTEAAWLLLRDYAIPPVLGKSLRSAEDAGPLTEHIRGHRMARGGLLRLARLSCGRRSGRCATPLDHFASLDRS